MRGTPRDVAAVHGALTAHATQGPLVPGDLYGRTWIFAGDAPGVDKIAQLWWANGAQVDLRIFEADWKLLGKAAGPERNERMVAAALAFRDTHRLIGLAFPGPKSSGTWDCVRQMRAAGIEVHTWEMSE